MQHETAVFGAGIRPGPASVRLDERDNLRVDATTGEPTTDRERAEPTRFNIAKPGAHRPGQLTVSRRYDHFTQRNRQRSFGKRRASDTRSPQPPLGLLVRLVDQNGQRTDDLNIGGSRNGHQPIRTTTTRQSQSTLSNGA